MILQRVLAVLAAVLLVAAVGVATFGAQSLSLGEALFLVDASSLNVLQHWLDKVWGAWAWRSVVQPLLVRPAWLVPASVGIVCTGLAFSLSNRKTTHRSHRRS